MKSPISKFKESGSVTDGPATSLECDCNSGPLLSHSASHSELTQSTDSAMCSPQTTSDDQR